LHAEVFAALGDETRLALIRRLGEGGPASTVRLSAGAGMTRQAVTKHLGVLERARLVRHRRQGRETLWDLEPEGFDKARAFIDAMSRQWDARLEALRRFVED
jgi:DNA-binding transcriptional ArsR family regulator